jgi:hypothetical protein
MVLNKTEKASSHLPMDQPMYFQQNRFFEKKIEQNEREEIGIIIYT